MKPILIIIAVCFVVYFNALFGGLVSDDNLIITPAQKHNIVFNNVGWLITSIANDWLGDNTVAHHFINIAFHTLMCVLLFHFLKIFFPEYPSLIAVFLFAVLPIHTENVTWISGLNHLLEGVCFLSVFLLFHKKKYLWALLVFTLFAISASPWIALIPIFLLIFLLMKFSDDRGRSFAWLTPFFAVLLIVFWANSSLIINRSYYVAEQMGLGKSLGFIDPLPRMAYALEHYFWLSVIPVNLTLYHYEPFLTSFPGELWLIMTIIFLSFAFGVFIILSNYKKAECFKNIKQLLLGFLIFIIFTIPCYSPVPIGAMVIERYAYIPTIAFSIALAFIIAKLGKKIVPVCLIILALYAVRTIDRNADYKTEERFWRATLAVSSYHPQALNNMGITYANESNILKALQAFHNAVKIKPDFKEAKDNLSLVEQVVKRRIEVKY